MLTYTALQVVFWFFVHVEFTTSSSSIQMVFGKCRRWLHNLDPVVTRPPSRPYFLIGRELMIMSELLEAAALTDLVAVDLRRREVKPTGRRGLPAECVLRCAVLKQYRQLSYEELAFYLSDSMSFRAFARLPVNQFPKKSALHKTISAIRSQTWEAINRHLLKTAATDRIETGRVIRLDSTVTLCPIHQPTDNSLLWDAMRLMVRLLRRVQTVPGVPKMHWRNRSRQARKHNRAIEYSRGQTRRLHHYKVLINACRASQQDLYLVETKLAGLLAAERWLTQYRTDMPLICRIIEQAERRVLQGQQVPSPQKLVSLFEPHTDIIRKGGRDVFYGHKLTLTTGRSGLILDMIIEDGNPADAERFLPILDRHIELYNKPPRQMAADGAYASNGNLQQAKSKGCAMSPSTRNAASPSKTWSKAVGSTESCAISAPGSKQTSPASSEPMVWIAAPGKGLTASRLMSGLPSWLTILP